MRFKRLPILFALFATTGTAFVILAAKQSVEPLYGYAVFGGSSTAQQPANSYVSLNSNEAESIEPVTTAPATRANFIVAGRDIYFDANNDGKPESSERFKKRGNSFEVNSPDGQSRYRLTNASLGVSPENVSESMPQFFILHVDVHDGDQPDSIRLRQTAKINVFPELADHGWAHFDGPLSLEVIDGNLKLPASGGPTVHLRLSISTPPVECGAAAADQKCYSNMTAAVPGSFIPTVTIEFPTASDQTITKRYDLDQFC